MALRRWHTRAQSRTRLGGAYRWWVLVTVLVGLLANNILFTVFVVALPAVSAGLKSSVATVTWVVTAPMLTYAVGAPLAGKSSDVLGHRRTYVAGMAASAVVAVASALAPDAVSLIAARAASGIAGAVVGASSMAIVFDEFPPAERAKAMGWWSLVGAGGPVMGIAVGGPLVEYLGWRSLFFAQAPLVLVATAAAILVLPARIPLLGAARRLATSGEHADACRDRPARPRRAQDELSLVRRLDLPGAGLLTLSVGSLLAAFNRAPELGFSSPAVLAMFAFAVLSALLLVVVERRVPAPLVPLHFLREPMFALPIGAQAFSNFAYMGGFFLAPLIFEQVFGYKEAATGLLSIPRPLVYSLVAPVAGYVTGRLGTRLTGSIGSAAVVASMGVFMLVGIHHGLVVAEAALVLSGVGLGVSTPALSAAVANVAGREALGSVSAAQQLVTQVGVVAGIQVMEAVQSSKAGHAHLAPVALLGSFRFAFAIGGVVALAGLACALASRDRRAKAVPTR